MSKRIYLGWGTCGLFVVLYGLNNYLQFTEIINDHLEDNKLILRKNKLMLKKKSKNLVSNF